MALDGYQASRGASPHELLEQQRDQRVDSLRAARENKCRLAFVYDYDPVAQTVDVVMMDDKRSLPIKGIPIAGAGGHGIRWIRAWKGVLQTDRPDIGFLVYPRLGAGRRFLDFIRRDTNAIYAHLEEKAIFVGGIPAHPSAGEVSIAGVGGDLSKNDNGVVDETGCGFMLQVLPDGKRRVLVRADDIYFLGRTQTVDDAQAVARQGDAGDGLGGSISGGSSNVFAG